MKSERSKIMVLGATGELGGRIVSLTEKYLPDAEIFTGSRHPAKGKHTIVDIFNAKQAAAALTSSVIAVFPFSPPMFFGLTIAVGIVFWASLYPQFIERRRMPRP